MLAPLTIYRKRQAWQNPHTQVFYKVGLTTYVKTMPGVKTWSEVQAALLHQKVGLGSVQRIEIYR